jgi:hypothetical protein
MSSRFLGVLIQKLDTWLSRLRVFASSREQGISREAAKARRNAASPDHPGQAARPASSPLVTNAWAARGPADDFRRRLIIMRFRRGCLKRSLAHLFLAASALLFANLVLAEAPGFSGSWVMDQARSEGLPPDMEQRMTITAREGAIDVTTMIVSDRGDRTIADTYTLDGAEHEFQPQMPNFPKATGKRAVKPKGPREFTSTDHIDHGNGAKTEITRHFLLADDGRTLTIELDASGPNGIVKSKRLFARQ